MPLLLLFPQHRAAMHRCDNTFAFFVRHGHMCCLTALGVATKPDSNEIETLFGSCVRRATHMHARTHVDMPTISLSRRAERALNGQEMRDKERPEIDGFRQRFFGTNLLKCGRLFSAVSVCVCVAEAISCVC